MSAKGEPRVGAAESAATLSVVLVTQDQATLLPRLLANVDSIAEEIVAVDGGSSDATAELLRAHPKVRYARREIDTIGRQKSYAIGLARCDWVLVIDSDELLSEALRSELPRLLRSRWRNWYKLPRYWLTSLEPPRYVHADLLYPDFQLRLFRNSPFWRYEDLPSHARFPRRGRGRGQKLQRGHLLHLDFAVHDRARREQKFARYERLQPGYEANRAYLWEDLPHEIRPCPERPPADSR